MADRGEEQANDKMRLCPTCRMAISVLATKCRHCGENVGRPRDEARQLSVDDLGGDVQDQYVPSGSVIDALEAYRAEEFSPSASEKDSKHKGARHGEGRGRGQFEESGGEEDGIDVSGLPGLDQRDDPLASLFVPVHPKQPAKPAAPSWRKNVLMLGYFMAAVIVLYFGGGFATAKIRDYIAAKNAPPVTYIENKALTYLERGELIPALQEALQALSEHDTDENRRIVNQARREIAWQVADYLDADPWTRDFLMKASQLANQAYQIDSSELIAKVREEVEQENKDYGMTLTDTDAASRAAVLQLYNGKTITVMEDKKTLVNGRFLVKRVATDEVWLEDTMRQREEKYGRNRIVIFPKRGLPRGHS